MVTFTGGRARPNASFRSNGTRNIVAVFSTRWSSTVKRFAGTGDNLEARGELRARTDGGLHTARRGCLVHAIPARTLGRHQASRLSRVGALRLSRVGALRI